MKTSVYYHLLPFRVIVLKCAVLCCAEVFYDTHGDSHDRQLSSERSNYLKQSAHFEGHFCERESMDGDEFELC